MASQVGLDYEAYIRTAVNRLYYASYFYALPPIEALPLKQKPKHSDIPEILTKTLVRYIDTQTLASLKRGLLTHKQREQIRTATKHAARGLADTLQQCYAVRVKADYVRTNLASKDGQHFCFEEVQIVKITAYPRTAARHAAALMVQLKEAGIV